MALLFCDSFDHYSALNSSGGTNAGGKWSASGNSNDTVPFQNIGPGLGRPSSTDAFTGGCNCFSGHSIAQTYGSYFQKNLNLNASSLFVGFAFKFDILSATSSIRIFSFSDIGTPQVTIELSTAGQLSVTRNGTFLGNSATLISPNIWYYIELGVTFSTTVGTVTLRQNTIPTITLTGVNTSASGNAFANQIYICAKEYVSTGGSTAAQSFFDDLYLNDGTTAINNTFLGDVRIRPGFASSNGTQNNYSTVFASWVNATPYALYTTITDGASNVWRCTTAGTSGGSITWPVGPSVGATKTDNTVVWTCVATSLAQWAAINETYPDGSSSYISSNTVGDQSRFNFPTTSGSQVYGVAINAFAIKDDAGSRSIRMVTKSGGVVADNGTDFALAPGPAYLCPQGIIQIDPATGVAWTISGYNAAEFGVKTTV